VGIANLSPLDPDGVWCEILPQAVYGRPALFLDRDGVMVQDTNYLCCVEDVRIIPGAGNTIAAANRLRIAVILVTNQAGIGRGYYGWSEFITVQQAILAALAAKGARLDAVYACAHHPKGKGTYFHPNHPARKPNPGMLLRAAADLSLDLQNSWLIGDKVTDIEAARRAGLAGALHVLTGYGAAERFVALGLATPTFDVRLGQSIADAMILSIFAGLSTR
jgi:D-glycero-D-manno-heptose 1,7-bisphosphate phosphatase